MKENHNTSSGQILSSEEISQKAWNNVGVHTIFSILHYLKVVLDVCSYENTSRTIFWI